MSWKELSTVFTVVKWGGLFVGGITLMIYAAMNQNTDALILGIMCQVWADVIMVQMQNRVMRDAPR